MAKRRDSKGRFTKDSLATFTGSITGGYGGYGDYRDSPLHGINGYSKDVSRKFYRQSWIAKQAVERIPEDCFRKGYTWVADAEQLSLIEAVEKRHKIKEKKKKAKILSRLDGEAYLYFDTGDDPSEELNLDRVGRDGLKFVNLFTKSNLTKGQRIKDPLSPLYGEPEVYYISGANQSRVEVHPSRVCRFIDNADPTTGDGNSVLDYLLAVIEAAEVSRDNTVALTTEARIDVLSVCGLMDAVSDPETEANIVKRYSLMRQGKATNKMLVLDKDNEEYSQKSATFTTLPDVIETMRREVSAALEIPHAILFGRESGLGTNGEMELATYYDRVQTIQRTEIQDVCASLDEVIIRSALGSRPEEIFLEWESLWQESDKEKAEIGNTIADMVSKLVSSGVIPPEALTEPTVNALTENGSLQGLEQSYADWLAGGGDLGDLPDDDEGVTL